MLYSCCIGNNIDIEKIVDIIVGLGTIGTFIIGVITLVNLLKYIERKRADSVFGFYSRLRWCLKFFRKSIGVYLEEINGTQENYVVNVLYAFSENNELRKVVTEQQKMDFENYRTEIIELLCKNDNQVSLNNELFDTNIENLFKFVTKFKGILKVDEMKNYIFSSNISQEDIDSHIKEIDSVISSLIKIINEAVSETQKGSNVNR